MIARGPTDADGARPSTLFDGGPLADPEERKVIFAALDSFRQYRQHTHYHTTHRRRQNFYALPSSQWQMLAAPPFSLLDTFNAVDDAIDANADLADAILELGLASLGLDDAPADDPLLDWRGTAKPSDMTKAHATVRQFYRDWSAAGFALDVQPLLAVVLSDLAAAQLEPGPHGAPSVLLPGAGLGRLLLELVLAGYDATGNEISYHQLLASNFVLNHTARAGQHAVYPFAHTFTNLASRAQQLARHPVPDVHPATALADRAGAGGPVGEMNMTAGDFVLSYAGADARGQFDAVVSVFFIDTAPNLLRYIDAVRNCLRPGGLWINIGPLLWHFDDRAIRQPAQGASGADSDREDDGGRNGAGASQPGQAPMFEDRGVGEPGTFELSDDEVLQLVGSMGFSVEKHEILDNAGAGYGYMQDPSSLLQSRYKCSHWVARRE